MSCCENLLVFQTVYRQQHRCQSIGSIIALCCCWKSISLWFLYNLFLTGVLRFVRIVARSSARIWFFFRFRGLLHNKLRYRMGERRKGKVYRVKVKHKYCNGRRRRQETNGEGTTTKWWQFISIPSSWVPCRFTKMQFIVEHYASQELFILFFVQ